MPVLSFSTHVIPSSDINQFKLYNPNTCRTSLLGPIVGYVQCCFSRISFTAHRPLKSKTPSTLNVISRSFTSSDFDSFGKENMTDFDYEDEELGDFENAESPWEGAVIYSRNPSITHLEYCTTLERLGLGSLSTEVSKSRASVMGLRVTKSVKEHADGTPVQISIDVTRKKQKLRLDGIIRTVLTLGCNRCGEPAAECVFSNFSLLLTEEPPEEPEVINMGVLFGEDKLNGGSEGKEEDDEASIDLDDHLYFPSEQREIDISKNIRDMVHVEITINAICNPSCQGLCLKCGLNLNTGSCVCRKEKLMEKGYGPLGNLRKQMQRK